MICGRKEYICGCLVAWDHYIPSLLAHASKLDFRLNEKGAFPLAVACYAPMPWTRSLRFTTTLRNFSTGFGGILPKENSAHTSRTSQKTSPRSPIGRLPLEFPRFSPRFAAAVIFCARGLT